MTFKCCWKIFFVKSHRSSVSQRLSNVVKKDFLSKVIGAVLANGFQMLLEKIFCQSHWNSVSQQVLLESTFCQKSLGKC